MLPMKICVYILILFLCIVMYCYVSCNTDLQYGVQYMHMWELP